MRRAVVKYDRGEVAFTRIGPNHVIPMQPWPQHFYVTRTLLHADGVELRPLTVTGLVKGIGRNFVTMNFWRLCWVLRGLGFLNTPEAGCYRWGDLTLAFWRHQQIRRFQVVRWLAATFDNKVTL